MYNTLLPHPLPLLKRYDLWPWRHPMHLWINTAVESEGGPGFMSPPASPTTHPGLCSHSTLSPQDLRVPSDHSRVVFPCLQDSPQRWHFSGSRLHELPHPEKLETDPRELESWFSKSTTLICSDWFLLGISQQNPSLYLRYYWLFKQMWKYKLI